MNIWQNAVITEKGLSLQAKLIAGTSLTITRAVAGSGFVNAGLLQKQVDVTDPEQELAFAGVSYPEAGKCAVRAKLKNDGLYTGYTARQLGFYAEDPDEGEILYFLAQSDSSKGTEVPSESEMPGYSAEWTCYFQYGNADNVNVAVDPSNTISAEEARQMVDAHANDGDNPHGVTKEQIGLGNVDDTSDSEKYVAFASTAGSANKTKAAVTIRFNGGSSEGTNLFTFDGSVAKSINITPSRIGAVSASDAQGMVDDHANDTNNPHNVTKEQLGLDLVDNTADSEKYVSYASTAGTGNKTKASMTVRFNGGSTEGTDMFTFNGSTAKSINITPDKIGAMPANRIHFTDDGSEPADWEEGDIWLTPAEE